MPPGPEPPPPGLMPPVTHLTLGQASPGVNDGEKMAGQGRAGGVPAADTSDPAARAARAHAGAGRIGRQADHPAVGAAVQPGHHHRPGGPRVDGRRPVLRGRVARPA